MYKPLLLLIKGENKCEIYHNWESAQNPIMYILDRDPQDVDKVLEKLINLDPNIKDMITSGLQRMVTQSEEKGIQLGIIKGKKEALEDVKKVKMEALREGIRERDVAIAKQMLSEDMDKSLISRVTGLSMKEIDSLQG